jgi:hypothetical protein
LPFGHSAVRSSLTSQRAAGPCSVSKRYVACIVMIMVCGPSSLIRTCLRAAKSASTLACVPSPSLRAGTPAWPRGPRGARSDHRGHRKVRPSVSPICPSTLAVSALSHQPFLLGCTHLLAEVGFNKVNGLENQSRTAREPLLARCDGVDDARAASGSMKGQCQNGCR